MRPSRSIKGQVMELQRGITGIQSTKDPMPVLASTDLKAFRSHCHEAARALGAKVPNIKNRWDGVGICNFAIARFDFSDSNVAVLLNVIHPYSHSPSTLLMGRLFSNSPIVQS